MYKADSLTLTESLHEKILLWKWKLVVKINGLKFEHTESESNVSLYQNR